MKKILHAIESQDTNDVNDLQICESIHCNIPIKSYQCFLGT